MNLKELPIVIYDNQCYLCVKFAEIVNKLARGKITFVGHYSEFGENLRLEILDSSALEMFWFVDNKTAYGGRAALMPLLKTILFARKKINKIGNIQGSCNTDCKNVKSVFIRSTSLVSNSRKINLK